MPPPTAAQLAKYGLNPSLAGAPNLDVPENQMDATLKHQANQNNAYNGLYDQVSWAKNLVAGTGAAAAYSGAVGATTYAAQQGAQHTLGQITNP